MYGAHTVGIAGDPVQLVGPAPPGDDDEELDVDKSSYPNGDSSSDSD